MANNKEKQQNNQKIRIQLLCFNKDCEDDIMHFQDIDDLWNKQKAGEVKCKNCGGSKFSIVILSEDRNERDLSLAQIEKIIIPIYLLSYYNVDSNNKIGTTLRISANKQELIDFCEENGITKALIKSVDITKTLEVFTYEKGNLYIAEE